MNDFVSEQVRADLLGHSLLLAQQQGVRPVYFSKHNRLDPSFAFAEILNLSRYFWTCFGFTGLMTPWHDDPECMRQMWDVKSYIRKWLWICEDMDVDWRSYCVLSFCMSDYTFYDRPTLLLGQRPHWSWIRAFRRKMGSRKLVDETAFFLMEFMRIQIEHRKRAHFPRKVFLEVDKERVSKSRKPLRLRLYVKIANRIRQLQVEGVDYMDWLRVKCLNYRRMDPESTIEITAIVNLNALDPSLDGLRAAAADEWRALREFLGLVPECEFPDECIPKGWQPASDDVDNRRKIRKITADGYYYTEDGTQRRGKRHYATNKYLTIKVGPGNFEEFKASWNDPRYLSGRPTWTDYERYALYPGLWDEKGENVSEYPMLKNIRWRKK